MQTDKEAFEEFKRGVASAIAMFGVIALLFGIFATPDESLQKGVESPRFGVVDKYKGCDVVRYTPDNSARYAYFLDCHES